MSGELAIGAILIGSLFLALGVMAWMLAQVRFFIGGFALIASETLLTMAAIRIAPAGTMAYLIAEGVWVVLGVVLMAAGAIMAIGSRIAG